MAEEAASNLVRKEPPSRPIREPSETKIERVKIMLEENDNIPPNGQYFGLNGKGYLIKPGEVVNVPRGIVDILDNAVMTVAVTNPSTGRIMGYRDRLRYPYRLMG